MCEAAQDGRRAQERSWSWCGAWLMGARPLAHDGKPFARFLVFFLSLAEIGLLAVLVHYRVHFIANLFIN